MTPDGTKFGLFVKREGDDDFQHAGIYIDASTASIEDVGAFCGWIIERLLREMRKHEGTTGSVKVRDKPLHVDS